MMEEYVMNMLRTIVSKVKEHNRYETAYHIRRSLLKGERCLILTCEKNIGYWDHLIGGFDDNLIIKTPNTRDIQKQLYELTSFITENNISQIFIDDSHYFSTEASERIGKKISFNSMNSLLSKLITYNQSTNISINCIFTLL